MTKNRKELIKVQLSVYKPFRGYPGRCKDYFLAVVGPGLQLGNEDPNIAVRCYPTGHHFWTKQVWLPKEKDVYFKFLFVKASNNAIMDIEEIIPHRLYVGQNPLRVEMMYNKATLLVKEADEEFKTPQTRKHNAFFIPSLNIKRSDRYFSRLDRPEEISTKFISSVKTDPNYVAPGVDNIIGVIRPEHQVYNKNEICTQPEAHRDFEMMQATQAAMTNPRNNITYEAQKEKEVTKQQKQPTKISSLISTLKEEEKMACPIREPKIASPMESTALQAVEKGEAATNTLVELRVTSHTDNATPHAVKENETNPMGMVEPKIVSPTNYTSALVLEKTENIADTLDELNITNPKDNTTLKETEKKEDMRNPLSEHKVIGAADSTIPRAIEKKEKVASTLSEPKWTCPTVVCKTTLLSQTTMPCTKNTNKSTVKTATVKPLSFPKPEVSAHFNEPTATTPVASDNEPKTVDKRDIVLAAAGMAFVSYLGYRVLS